MTQDHPDLIVSNFMKKFISPQMILAVTVNGLLGLGQNVCPNIIVIVFYSIVIYIYSTKGMFVHVLFWLLLHS